MSVANFPCPTCGGGQAFDPDAQALRCSYCNGTQAIELSPQVPKRRLDDADETAVHDWGAETRNMHCNACGAGLIRDTRIQSDICPFCGSSMVEDATEPPGLLPEGVIAFRISKGKAKAAFDGWIRGRRLAPFGFAKQIESADGLTGLYLPFWLFHCDTHSAYDAQRGDHYYVTETRARVINGKTQTETVQVQHTRWTPVSGVFDSRFDNVPKQASGHAIVESASGFDTERMCAYRKAFLAGFAAERYTIPLARGWEQARRNVDATLKARVEGYIGGDVVQWNKLDTEYRNVEYQHALFPCWISTYRYKNRPYSFVVNGQTGAVRGESPLSTLKLLGIIAAVLLALLLIVYMVNG